MQLSDVLGVRFASWCGADPPLELDEGVQSSQVNSTAGGTRRRTLLAPDKAGKDEKVPHRAGDVGLGIEVVMPTQFLGGGIPIPGVVRINVHRNSAFYSAAVGPCRLAADSPATCLGRLSWLHSCLDVRPRFNLRHAQLE